LKTDPELLTPDNAPFKAYLANSGRHESAHLKTS
jgi:hypothetical protein